MFKDIAFNDSAEAAYCEKLAKHFSSMGISPKASEAAVASLVAKNAVPDFVPCAATPSMFGIAKPATAAASPIPFEGDFALQA